MAKIETLDLFAWATTPQQPLPACEVCGATGVPLTMRGQFDRVCPKCAPPLAAPEVLAVPAAPPKLTVALPGARDQHGYWCLRRELRPYQADIRRLVHEAKAAGKKRALVVAATGAGKTVCFSALAADMTPTRTLILTDQLDLVNQAIRSVKDTTGLFADAEQGQRSASTNAQIVVATVQTLALKLTKYAPDHFDFIVCDECDRAISATWRKVLAYFENYAFVLGVTATPKRADKKKLTYFGDKLIDVGTLDLIEKGYLATISVQTLPMTIDLTPAEELPAEGKESEEVDYDKDKVAECVKKCFREVCRAIREHARNRKILVFLPNVATSIEFAEIACLEGIPAEHIDGESRDRAGIQQRFRDREFQLLANPCLLGRGYDDPSIDCVINLRATKSLGFYQQAIGRGTRLFCPHGCPGPCTHEDRKRDLLILDFLYQFKGMGPIRPSQLIADTPAKALAMQKVTEGRQGKLDLRAIAAQAERDIRAALLQALKDAQRAKGAKGTKEYFNAFQWAALLNLTDLSSYEPDTEADARPPKKGLVTKLTMAGFVRESITCQGHAEKLMEVVQARRDAGLCSFKQLFWLQKMGVKEAEQFTREQAEQRLAAEFANKPRRPYPGQQGKWQRPERKWVKPPSNFGYDPDPN